MARGRRLLAFLNLGLVMCAILAVFVLLTSVLVENGSVAWAATKIGWQAGYATGRYGREWPMCVMNYPSTPEPFNPALVPL